MPIYEYRCTKCGHRFEAIQKVSDTPLSKCEKCKGKAERLVSSPAIQFKGTGWYITDYARKGASETPAKDKDTPPETTSSEKTEKTEKPAAKKGKQKAGSSTK